MNARLAAFAAAAALVACGSPPPQEDAPRAPLAAAAGPELYRLHCGVCHGPDGKGNGPAAEFLFPKPRDFSTATYKLRSTPSGELPTDDDLLRTITRGIPGTAMPAFEPLPLEERRALVQHLKTLAAIERDGKRLSRFDVEPPRALSAGAEPGTSPERLAHGRTLYAKMQCGQCHGESGVGDGPSAPTLVDRWGWPNPPANFANGVFKGGDSAADVYMRFTTGMNGTPMPSYEKNLSDDERWALAYYVKSLVNSGRKPLAYHGGGPVAAAETTTIPLDPLDPAWAKAPVSDVPLMSMWQRAETPNHVGVRVLRSKDRIGFLLEWEDPTADGAALGMQEFSDAVAVLFTLDPTSSALTMGEKGKPCNLWQWRFSRQLDMASFRDVEQRYPALAVDHYPYQKDAQTYAARFPGHRPMEGAPSHDKAHLTAWAAGNSLSPPVPTSAVEDLNAEGFGTLRPQPPGEQNVEGRGVWSGGRWRVVLRRARAGSGMDVDLAGDRPFRIALAVWDGRSGDRDGKKLISGWTVVTP